MSILPIRDAIFVGRESELVWLADALRAHRVVEIVGPCGVGKTTLSVHSGWRHLDRTQTPVRFCELSASRNPTAVIAALASTLQMDVDGMVVADLTVNAIAATLRQRGELLLILDNFEQLTQSSRGLVLTLLEEAPELRLLVTSREPLGIRQSVRLSLKPLVDDVAVQLLADRAKPLAPAFEVDEHNRAHVLNIVRRLDGLPLALEMAAPWLQVMSAEELSQQLTVGLTLQHDCIPATAHHSSMDRAIAWSWELLSEAARDVMRCVAMFEGSFELSDAEANVVGCSTDEVLTALRHLREHSMLFTKRAQSSCGISFALYRSVRAFVRRQPGYDTSETRDRYAQYIVKKAESLSRGVEQGDASALDRLCRLREDLEGVFERSLGDDKPLALRASLVLCALFARVGPIERLLHFSGIGLEIAEAADEPSTRARAGLVRAGALAAAGQSDAAQAVLANASAQAARVEARDLEAKIHVLAADVAYSRCEPELFGRHNRLALWLCRNNVLEEHLEVPRLLAEARCEPKARERLLEKARRIVDNTGDQAFAPQVAVELGRFCAAAGRPKQALAHLSHALDEFARTGALVERVRALNQFAGCLIDLGDLEGARGKAEEALTNARSMGLRPDEATSLGRLGMIAFELGELEEALEHLRLAEKLLAGFGQHRRHSRVLMIVASTWFAAGSPRQALKACQRGCDVASRSREPLIICYFQALSGAISLRSGNYEDALSYYAAGRDCAPTACTQVHGQVLKAFDAMTALAEARARGDGGEREAVGRALATLASSSSLAARSCRMLREALVLDIETGGLVESSTLEVGSDANYIRVNGGPPVQLHRRGAIRRVLVALIDELESTTHRPMTLEELFERGWPGQRIMHHAAANRVYAALSSLRRLGLQDALLTRPNGWLLAPTIKLTRSDRRVCG